MRAVIQRVGSARVEVGATSVGSIGPGLVVLVGVAGGDGPEDAARLADKVAGLRIFEDEGGKMNLSVEDVKGSVLAISQFTLLGDCRKGRRPSFTEAAAPEKAEALYEEVVSALRARGLRVETGKFQAKMSVHLVNEGPVTLLLDTRRAF